MVHHSWIYYLGFTFLCVSLAQQHPKHEPYVALRNKLNQPNSRRAPQQPGRQRSSHLKPKTGKKQVPLIVIQETQPTTKTKVYGGSFLNNRKKRIGNSTKLVVAPFAESASVLNRIQACSKLWKVSPIEPSTWTGSKVFPANNSCKTMIHTNENNEKDEACVQNRFATFPKCGISLIVPHKSASSMIFAQFENICGEVNFEAMVDGHIEKHGFGFDHKQDTINTNDEKVKKGEQSSRKGGGGGGGGERAGTESGTTIRRERSLLDITGGGDSNAVIDDEEKRYVVAVFRDPIDRVIGMFNMMAGKDVNFGTKDIEIYSEKEISKYEAAHGSPTIELIQERFSRFLSHFIKNKPVLKGAKLTHFTPQAR